MPDARPAGSDDRSHSTEPLAAPEMLIIQRLLKGSSLTILTRVAALLDSFARSMLSRNCLHMVSPSCECKLVHCGICCTALWFRHVVSRLPALDTTCSPYTSTSHNYVNVTGITTQNDLVQTSVGLAATARPSGGSAFDTAVWSRCHCET